MLSALYAWIENIINSKVKLHQSMRQFPIWSFLCFFIHLWGTNHKSVFFELPIKTLIYMLIFINTGKSSKFSPNNTSWFPHSSAGRSVVLHNGMYVYWLQSKTYGRTPTAHLCSTQKYQVTTQYHPKTPLNMIWLSPFSIKNTVQNDPFNFTFSILIRALNG